MPNLFPSCLEASKKVSACRNLGSLFMPLSYCPHCPSRRAGKRGRAGRPFPRLFLAGPPTNLSQRDPVSSRSSAFPHGLPFALVFKPFFPFNHHLFKAPLPSFFLHQVDSWVGIGLSTEIFPPFFQAGDRLLPSKRSVYVIWRCAIRPLYVAFLSIFPFFFSKYSYSSLLLPPFWWILFFRLLKPVVLSPGCMDFSPGMVLSWICRYWSY